MVFPLLTFIGKLIVSWSLKTAGTFHLKSIKGVFAMSASEAISRFSGKTQDLTDKAASRANSHLNDAKNLVDDAGNTISSKLDSVTDAAGPMIDRASRRAQALASQGVDAAGRAAQQLSDSVSDFADSAISYTKKNPLKAVMIAAASGAVIFGLVKALSSSRE